MKFTVKSCNFIKVFIDFCYKRPYLKEKLNTAYCILIDCKHSLMYCNEL